MIAMAELMRVARFGFSGVVSTVIHAGVLFVLVDFLGLDPVVSTLPAFLVANINTYLMNRFWVFKARTGSATQFVVFFIVSIVSLLVNTLGMYIGTRILDLPYKITLVISVIVAAAITYLLHKVLTFREKSQPSEVS